MLCQFVPAVVFVLLGSILACQPACAEGSLDLQRTLIDRGNSFLRTGRFSEAVHAYQQVLVFDPENAIAKANIVEAHNNWGIYYFRQHQYAKAKAEWTQCLVLEPGHQNARRNLATLAKYVTDKGIDFDDAALSADKPLGGRASKGQTGVKQAGKDDAAGKQDMDSSSPGMPGAVLLTPVSRTAATMPDAGNDSGGKGAANLINNPGFSADYRAPNLEAGAHAGTGSNARTDEAGVGSAGRAGGESAVPATSAASALSSIDSGSGFEQQLAAIELKVYGQPQSFLTVIQRLEKLERDTRGSTASGTVVERINSLKAAFGIK